MCGRIEVISGCMFSGKTTELIRRIRRYMLANKECILVKHTMDDRYSSSSVVSHDERQMEAIVCSDLSSLKYSNAQIVAIDEGQFYTNLFEVCRELANEGKVVIVAALDATYLRTPFENVSRLCADAESITKLFAVCQREKDGKTCGCDASFTWRTASRDKPIEYVGGSEMYIPVCRNCYNDLNLYLK
jgi:thymidine kinase